MSGHHPFSNLTRGFSPERRRRVESVKADLVAQTPESRRARAFDQVEAAGGADEDATPSDNAPPRSRG